MDRFEFPWGGRTDGIPTGNQCEWKEILPMQRATPDCPPSQAKPEQGEEDGPEQETLTRRVQLSPERPPEEAHRASKEDGHSEERQDGPRVHLDVIDGKERDQGEEGGERKKERGGGGRE